MQCPHCRTQADEATLECPACRGDLGVTLTDPEGRTHGPYSLAQLRQYFHAQQVAPDAQAAWAGQEPVPVYRLLAEAGEPTVAISAASAPRPAAPAEAGAPPLVEAPAPAAPPRRRDRGCWVAGAIVVIILLLIAALVAAVAIPGFHRAREGARMSACQSNLKQLSLGMLMYAQDYDQALPPQANWQDVIYPYLRNEQIFNCPTTQLGRGSYQYNSVLDLRKLGTITQPGTSLMLWDTGFPSGPGPHNEGWNLAFVDGHVKWAGQAGSRGYQIKF